MPPKPKFTKEEIAQTALNIVKENGVSALTARELGKRLNSSASPIFTVFENMNEVKLAAREIAMREFEEYSSDFCHYSPAFKRFGMQMISYAVNKPELFKLLFMQEHTENQNFEQLRKELGGMVDVLTEMIKNEHGISKAEADVLFNNIWIYAYGICALCVNGVCSFSDEEMSKNLSRVFASLLMLIKSGNLNNVAGIPKKED